MTSRSEERFETRSLTMAAYLRSLGEEPELVKRSEPINGTVRHFGVWLFQSSGYLEAMVEVFQDGNARVEPTGFHNTMSQMRREVIAFLDS